MREYNFTLKFKLADEREDPGIYLSVLEHAGCDDALIGIGEHGYIALHFIRKANTASEAVSSAIANVKTTISNAKLAEVYSDFVGIPHIA